MWTRLGLLLVVAAMAVPLRADDPTTKLSVEVTNHRGTPIERANVIVKFSEGRSIRKLGKETVRTWEMRTNQKGVATFPAMPQGKVTLMVSADRYQTFGEEFEIIEEEKTIQVELLPPQQPYTSHQ